MVEPTAPPDLLHLNEVGEIPLAKQQPRRIPVMRRRVIRDPLEPLNMEPKLKFDDIKKLIE
jgi:hypothetical protein